MLIAVVVGQNEFAVAQQATALAPAIACDSSNTSFTGIRLKRAANAGDWMKWRQGLAGSWLAGRRENMRVIGDHPEDRPILSSHLDEPIERVVDMVLPNLPWSCRTDARVGSSARASSVKRS